MELSVTHLAIFRLLVDLMKKDEQEASERLDGTRNCDEHVYGTNY